MTNNQIEKLIDALNTGQMADHIFRVSISPNVDYAFVWIKAPDINQAPPYHFYFIKNENGIFVAAVLDIYEDLHLFVKEEHRKQGHLCRAMNDSIFPHLRWCRGRK